MGKYNYKWIHNLLDIEPESWETIEVDGKNRQIMRLYLSDVNSAHRAGWFGVVEWRYNDDEESYAFVNSKSFSEASAISWIANNMAEYKMHSSPWGILVFAQNKRQVQDWLLEQGIPVRTAYNVQEPLVLQQKEEPMSSTARERRIAQAQRTIDRAQRQLDRLMAQPDEPVPNDDQPNVIWFEKRFGTSTGAHAYTYAAVKASDGLWYTTGPQAPKGYSWDRLYGWITEYDEDIEILVGTRFEPLA